MKVKRLLLTSVLTFFLVTSCQKEMKKVESTQENNNVNIVLDNNRGENNLLNDGKYMAEGTGYGGKIAVEMTVEGGYIKKVRVRSHEENEGVAGIALEDIPKEIVKRQSVKIDSISGATKTSEGIKFAAGDCIRQAGGINDWPKNNFKGDC